MEHFCSYHANDENVSNVIAFPDTKRGKVKIAVVFEPESGDLVYKADGGFDDILFSLTKVHEEILRGPQ